MSAKAYRAAGVDLDAAAHVKELFKPHVRSTFGPQVLGDIGFFGGLFHLQGYRDPVLVATTDGVGTKVKLALWMDRFDTLGYDVVNQSVNDILATGARPLFFLDYIAVEMLVPQQVEAIVKSIAEACRQVGCVLLGGETAQMRGVYLPGTFDLAGFMVGAAERDKLLDPSTVREGDTLIALPSSGLHTNGYSLVRAALRLEEDPSPLKAYRPELGRTLGEALLEPHRAYWPLLEPVLPLVRTMAHVTGGGLEENLARAMPKGLEGHIDRTSWEVPAIFRIIQARGEIPDQEMERVFNMGVGMVLVCAPERAAEVRRLLPEAWVVGKVAYSRPDSFQFGSNVMPQLQQVTDAEEVRKLWEQFTAAMKRDCKQYSRQIGHRGASGVEIVYWSPQHKIWGAYLPITPNAKPRWPRSWNVYGTEDPTKEEILGIAVETCIPHSGAYRRIAAAFAKLPDGEPCLVHDGRIGEHGRFQRGFLESLNRPIRFMDDGHSGKRRKVVIVASLNSDNLAQEVADFVHAAQKHKDAQIHIDQSTIESRRG